MSHPASRRGAAQTARVALCIAAWLAAPVLSMVPGPAAAGATTEHMLAAGSAPGSRDRAYTLYVPEGLAGPAPLVMALHGCEQTQRDVARDWGLTQAADRHRFVLVMPFITSYDGVRSKNCWGFWLDGHRREGAGEPEDLHRIVAAVEAQVAIDPARRYAVGLSSGGAMAAVLAVTDNETFAAVATAAGLPYGEDATAVSFLPCPGVARFHDVARIVDDMRAARDDRRPTPLMVLQNRADCVVLPTAAERLRDARIALDGDAAHATPDTTRAVAAPCAAVFGPPIACEHLRYTVDGRPGSRSLVETVLYDGPLETPFPDDQDKGHYWVGGADGRDGPYARREGPSYPDLVWDFFARHPAVASVPVEPPPGGCERIASSPSAHVGARRARFGGWFLSRAVSTGDAVDIGFAYDWFSTEVALTRGADERWYVAPPAGCGG